MSDDDDERDPDYAPPPFLVSERLRGTVLEAAACFERWATEFHAQVAFVPGERRLIEHSDHSATLLIKSGRRYNDPGSGFAFPDPELRVTVRRNLDGTVLETEMTTPGYDVSGNLTPIFEELRARLVAEGFIVEEPAQLAAVTLTPINGMTPKTIERLKVLNEVMADYAAKDKPLSQNAAAQVMTKRLDDKSITESTVRYLCKKGEIDWPRSDRIR